MPDRKYMSRRDQEELAEARAEARIDTAEIDENSAGEGDPRHRWGNPADWHYPRNYGGF